MTDRISPREHLLSAILAAQIEQGEDDFDADSCLARLQQGEAISAAERHRLLVSPLARSRLKDRVDIANAELAARVRATQVDLEVLPLVAASHDPVTTVEARGWRLSIFREDLPHMAWSLTLQLGDELARIRPARVKIVDDGGLCWMEGRPDRRAELSVAWPLNERTPIERLAGHRLQLELLAV